MKFEFELQAYDPDVGQWGAYGGMGKSEDGDWVSRDDVADLLRALVILVDPWGTEAVKAEARK